MCSGCVVQLRNTVTYAFRTSEQTTRYSPPRFVRNLRGSPTLGQAALRGAAMLEAVQDDRPTSGLTDIRGDASVASIADADGLCGELAKVRKALVGIREEMVGIRKLMRCLGCTSEL